MSIAVQPSNGAAKTSGRRPNAKTVGEAAKGNWDRIYAGLAPDLLDSFRAAGSTKHFPCPVHGGENGDAWRFFGDDSGGGICNSCGPKPDGFSVLMFVKGWSFPQALDEVADFLGIRKKANTSKINGKISHSIDSPTGRRFRRPNCTEIREHATGMWASIVKTTKPSYSDAVDAAGTDELFECPRCKQRKFRFDESFEEIGSAVCDDCGTWKDGFYTLCSLLDWNFEKSFDLVAEALNFRSVEEAIYRSTYQKKEKPPSKIDAVYPYHFANKELAIEVVRFDPKDFRQRRPDGNGGFIWNIKGVDLPLYRLPELRAADIADPVFLCEGEKDADNVRSLGLIATTMAQGAGKWRPGYTETLTGRHVIVLIDNDEAGRQHGEKIAQILQGAAASVKVLLLPNLPPKGDVSDWIAAGGTKEQLLEETAKADHWTPGAAIGQPVSLGSIIVTEAANDPHRLARGLIEKKYTDEQNRSIAVYWQDSLKKYDGKRYFDIPPAYVRAQITSHCKLEADLDAKIAIASDPDGGKNPQPFKVTTKIVSDCNNALTSMLSIDPRTNLLSWIGGDSGRPTSIIALENGLLDVNAYLAGSLPADCLLPHTPDWFSMVCLPYSFDPAATCPTWMATITYNLEEDAESIAMLQEYAGYCTIFDTDAQKFLVMSGDGGNGKNAIVAGIEAMLGVDNVSHVGLENFGQRFQLTPTLGKLANIVGDTGEIDRVAEGTLKSFTSGERLLFDRKGRDPIEALPTARLIICCNDPPRIKDRSEGPYRRMIFVPFNRTIPDEKRVLGMDKPAWWERSGELPGMLVWALAGLKRLRENGGRFTIPERSKKAMEQYRRTNNTARAFLNERCKATDNEAKIAKQIVFDAYRQWCAARNAHPLGIDPFGKELKKLFPFVTGGKTEIDIRDDRDRLTGKKKRVNAYVGLELSEDEKIEGEADVEL